MTGNGVWIVIAAYNEEQVLQSVVQRVTRDFAHVIVVDDGSADATGHVAQQAGAYSISHPINLGQGAALQTGIDFALSKNAEVIVTFDADGQHNTADVDRMIRRLLANDLDVVIGSRFLGEAIGIPVSRKLLLKAAALFTRLTSGVKVTDAHNGLRVFKASALRRVRIQQNRMAHASEIVDLIGSLRLKVAEEPVSIEYTAYSLAKGQRLTNSVSILIDLLMGKFGR